LTDAQKENYVPAGSKRPPDEFYDLKMIVPLRTENVLEDGSIVKIVVEEGAGNVIDDTDTVYYKHETRFDNGQLVDLNETRKVGDKFVMNDNRYHDFLRSAFLTMKKGELAFLKIGESQHRGIYHKNNL